MTGPVHIRRFVVSALESNCYVVAESAEPGSRAVIVDPGDIRLDPVFEHVERLRLRPVAVWHTHGHFDHMLGADIVRRRYGGIPALLHPDDAPVWRQAHIHHEQWLAQPAAAVAPADGPLADGQRVACGHLGFTVWHTPGHSPGSVCFVGDEIVLSGDLLFAGSIGRTDLPLGDPEVMRRSLRRALEWDDAWTVHPGHGDRTTMAVERRWNPFLEPSDRDEA